MTTNRTAIVNVIYGTIRILAHGQDTDIDHDADGRMLFLLADLEPWDAEEESMDRADAALADMGWRRVSEWVGQEIVTCQVTPA
ncbi:MAG TPA: hypothetical protein VKZ67_06005 [Natronosporangium sp.]|nr:hypothetical protein [Natronosporangium sp.]